MPIWRQLALPVAAMIAVVVASNVAVQFPINDWLTWGAFTYPIAFLVTDLSNRAFGPARARQVILVGFLLGVVLSILAATPRIAIASGSAFLVAQLLDVMIFHRMRKLEWWRAPLASSLIASAVDTILFFALAFAATGLPWVTWAVGDYAAKLAMAAILLLPYRALVRHMPQWQAAA
jgi:queuosine precursor transporter